MAFGLTQKFCVMTSSYTLIFHHLPSIQQFAPKKEATIVDNHASGGAANSLRPDKSASTRNKMEVEEEQETKSEKAPHKHKQKSRLESRNSLNN